VAALATKGIILADEVLKRAFVRASKCQFSLFTLIRRLIDRGASKKESLVA
jgi:hypothetical protein